MNYRSLLYLLGSLLLLTSAFLLLFALVGFFIYPEEKQGVYFLSSSVITLVIGLLFLFNRIQSLNAGLTFREGFAIASLGWVLVALFGSLPFYFSGVVSSFTDAYFESISGFTTTGASILSDVEGIGHTMLIWRSFTQWLGGMGIIVLTLAIIPTLGTGGMQLFIAEVPGPTPDKIVPRVGQTAKNLYLTYTFLTVAEILLLYGGGMSLFESLCHSFSTLSTGGFSPLNSSIGSYSKGEHFHENHLYFEIVIIFFMFLAGANFALHYRFLTGNFKSYFKNYEFFHYVGIGMVMMFLVGLDLYLHNVYKTPQEVLRHTSFTVLSIYTSSGFGTEDFVLWPSTSKVLILSMMFFGGMSGSTTGGIKTMRIVAMFKQAFAEVAHAIHPKRIFTTHFGQEHLSREVTNSINTFMILFLIVYVIGVALLSYTGLDIESITSMVASCLGNIGPGLSEVGPTKNYSLLPVYAKWVLSLFMLMGRLELLPIIVLFLPRMWYR